jgi:hypothetical protein
VNRAKGINGLAWFLGVGFMLLGIAEVAVRVAAGNSSGLAFWFLSLCGGGASILIGNFVLTRRPVAAFALVTVGCLAATVATMWTLILPILALTLIVLTWRRSRECAGRVSG